MAYLAELSVSQNIQSGMVECLVNNELERPRKEAAVA
jgi:hypothetical protein